MDKIKLTRLMDSLQILEHEIDCHKCAEPSDEAIDNIIADVVNLLWSEASRTLRGDGWVLTRES